MANNLNIGSVVSPDVLKTISSATAIKTFGNQLINKAKEKVISTVLGKAQEIKDQIQEIITLKIKIWSDHGTEMKRLEILLKEKQITQEQYNKAVAKEEEAYKNKLADLEDLDLKLKEDLANIIADPYAKIKDKLRKRKLKRAKRKNRNRAERAKARRSLIKKLAINAAKIDQANTPETIAIATNLRNNAIKLINNSISKLTNLEKTIAQISLYITIFTAVVAILSAIPIPTAVPPGIGIPVNVITRIVKSLEKAVKLIASLSVITAIAVTILESEISKLNELIERLKTVNQLLDSKSAINLNEQELADLTNAFLPTGNDFEMYKGFKFAIKEEQTLGAQQAIVVKGNKRRYAVAINRDGTEILKSDNSFTLDPNDLVDQLKLIIDQRNLQG